MPIFQDIAGQRFGRLIVIRFSHMAPGGSRWVCCCDCKTETVVCIGHLKGGKTKSCGCLQIEKLRDRNTRHGYAPKTPRRPALYNCWAGMMQRCYNPNSAHYKYYGVRGIEVHAPWHTFEVFLAYILATIGERPPGLSLDRINNDGNYEPGNVKWSTRSEQMKNRRPEVWQTRQRTSDGRFI